MMGPLDPSHDRDSQLVSRGPSTAVGKVLLRQGEGQLHGRVIVSRTDIAHRPEEAVAPPTRERISSTGTGSTEAAFGSTRGWNRCVMNQSFVYSLTHSFDYTMPHDCVDR